ncbi:Protein NHR-1 d [Aphelenchoides avenae]|nr:Protein NHR-1 d [Aphelenchus avenae]
MSATYAGMPYYSDYYYQAPPYGNNSFYPPPAFSGFYQPPFDAYHPPATTYALPPAVKEEVVATYEQPPALLMPPETNHERPALLTPPETSYQTPALLKRPQHSKKARQARTKLLVGTLCAICDDTASGTHYGVTSCTGCKTFFRRTIVDGHAEKLRCQYEGNCVVSKDVRNACRQCRFDKCLLAGMDMTAIQGTRDRRSSTISSPSYSSGRPKVPEGTPCAICEDVATGYHYGVAACLGCKAFFRRTIVAGHAYICQRDGNCVVNVDARMACRHCRFNKCLQAGMAAEAIQSSRDRRGPYKKHASEGSQQVEVASTSVASYHELSADKPTTCQELIRYV